MLNVEQVADEWSPYQLETIPNEYKKVSYPDSSQSKGELTCTCWISKCYSDQMGNGKVKYENLMKAIRVINSFLLLSTHKILLILFSNFGDH